MPSATSCKDLTASLHRTATRVLAKRRNFHGLYSACDLAYSRAPLPCRAAIDHACYGRRSGPRLVDFNRLRADFRYPN